LLQSFINYIKILTEAGITKDLTSVQ